MIFIIDYSYYDGSGHRKKITLKKGTTISKFLDSVKNDLSKEFHELRMTSSDNLIYVKEDLIIPHHFTFYDLIITKARGKSGPLFHFDVHDDVRLLHDARIEKDESHPGKVLERRFFEKNKHVFPLSRYELYDPNKSYEKYTTHGGEIHVKKK
jgi:protein FAM50